MWADVLTGRNQLATLVFTCQEISQHLICVECVLRHIATLAQTCGTRPDQGIACLRSCSKKKFRSLMFR